MWCVEVAAARAGGRDCIASYLVTEVHMGWPGPSYESRLGSSWQHTNHFFLAGLQCGNTDHTFTDRYHHLTFRLANSQPLNISVYVKLAIKAMLWLNSWLSIDAVSPFTVKNNLVIWFSHFTHYNWPPFSVSHFNCLQSAPDFWLEKSCYKSASPMSRCLSSQD